MVTYKTYSSTYTVPGLTLEDGHHTATLLQSRLHALNHTERSAAEQAR